MEEGKGKCPHGEFELRKGCPLCIEEKRTAASVVVQTHLVKVQYSEDSQGYTYYSVDRLQVGDIVWVPVKGRTGKGTVIEIDVPASEVEAFKDKVKTIPADSVILIEAGQPEPSGLAEAAKIAGTEVTEANLFPAIAKPTAVINVDPASAPSFAKHLEAANRIVEIAASREIATEGDAKAANDDLNVMAELRKAVEEERKAFTGPLNEYLSAINQAYKLINGPLREADQITRKLLAGYKVEQQRKAAEAEKLNQDAIDVARRQAEAHNGEFTVDTKPVPLPIAPKLTRTDQGKSGLVDNWKYRIVDLEKLPREYMVPDDAMLTSIAKKQHDKKQVAGVEFYNEPGLRVSR